MTDSSVVLLVRLLIGVFAIAGAADLLVWQKIMQPVRELVGIDHDDNGNRIGHNDAFFARVLWCFRCTTVWSAMFWVALWFSWPGSADRFLTSPYDALGFVTGFSLLAFRVYEHT